MSEESSEILVIGAADEMRGDEPPPSPRFRPRFHIRSFLIFVVFLAVVFSIFSNNEIHGTLIELLRMILPISISGTINLAILLAVCHLLGRLGGYARLRRWRRSRAWPRYTAFQWTLGISGILGTLLLFAAAQTMNSWPGLVGFASVFSMPFQLAGPLYLAHLARKDAVVPHGVILWAWVGICSVIEFLVMHPHLRVENLKLLAVLAVFTLCLILPLALFHRAGRRLEHRIDGLIGWCLVELHVCEWADFAWGYIW